MATAASCSSRVGRTRIAAFASPARHGADRVSLAPSVGERDPRRRRPRDRSPAGRRGSPRAGWPGPAPATAALIGSRRIRSAAAAGSADQQVAAPARQHQAEGRLLRVSSSPSRRSTTASAPPGSTRQIGPGLPNEPSRASALPRAGADGWPDLDLLRLGVDQHGHDPVRGQRARRFTGEGRIGRAPPPGRPARSRSDGARRRCRAAGATGRRAGASSGSTAASDVEQPVAVARAPLIGPGRPMHGRSARAIEVDGQDRRELGARCAQQRQPVRLRAGHGVLVRPHIGPVRLQQQPAPARPAPSARPASRCERARSSRPMAPGVAQGAICLHAASAAAAAACGSGPAAAPAGPRCARGAPAAPTCCSGLITSYGGQARSVRSVTWRPARTASGSSGRRTRSGMIGWAKRSGA